MIQKYFLKKIFNLNYFIEFFYFSKRKFKIEKILGNLKLGYDNNN
jgi:hypothetical protein